MTRIPVLLALVAACTPPAADPLDDGPAPQTEPGADPTGDPASDPDEDPTTVPLTEAFGFDPRLSGQVVDASGEPVTDYLVQACGIVCVVGVVLADGQFGFEDLMPTPQWFSVEPADASLASANSGLLLDPGEVRGLDPVVLDGLEPLLAVGEDALDLGGGLRVQGAHGMLPAEAGAAFVPGRGVPLDGEVGGPDDDAHVVATWHLGPWGVPIDVPWLALAVDDTHGLAPETSVTLWHAPYHTANNGDGTVSLWRLVAEGTVGDDGITLFAHEAITEFSTLVLVDDDGML